MGWLFSNKTSLSVWSAVPARPFIHTHTEAGAPKFLARESTQTVIDQRWLEPRRYLYEMKHHSPTEINSHAYQQDGT